MRDDNDNVTIYSCFIIISCGITPKNKDEKINDIVFEKANNTIKIVGIKKK